MPSPQSNQVRRSSVACEPCNKMSEEPLQTRALKSCLQLQVRVVQSWRLTGNRCASPQATELRSFTHDMWWEMQGCFLKPPNYAGAQPPSNLGIYACTEGCFLPCRVSNWLGARVSPQSCLCHVLTTCAEKHSKLLQAVMTMPLAFSFFFLIYNGNVSTVMAFLRHFFFSEKVSVIVPKIWEGCI